MHCLDLFQLDALPFHLGLILRLLDQAKYADRVRREHARDDRHVYPLYDHVLYAHRAYDQYGGNVIACENVLAHEVYKYGILDVEDPTAPITAIKGMVEKPTIDTAPSTLSIRGRYILQPDVFSYLDLKVTGANGEIQLTDAIASLIGKQDLFAYRFKGQLFDCGSKVGYIKATLAFAMERPELRNETSQAIAEYL